MNSKSAEDPQQTLSETKVEFSVQNCEGIFIPLGIPTELHVDYLSEYEQWATKVREQAIRKMMFPPSVSGKPMA